MRRLAIDKKQCFEWLDASNMAKRNVDIAIETDRKSVDRHLVGLISKGTNAQESPVGSAESKMALSKAPVGTFELKASTNCTPG